MQVTAKHTEVRVELNDLDANFFRLLELSRSKWLVTSISPGAGERCRSSTFVPATLRPCWRALWIYRRKPKARTGQCFGIISIQEAGLDGFWIHRVLEREGFESYLLNLSIATSRRRRRAKTDRIDGEGLVRALLAYKRGEPRVCAMLRCAFPGRGSTRRRAVRERRALLVRENKACQSDQGLALQSRGIPNQPLNRDRRERLETLVTGDGRRR